MTIVSKVIKVLVVDDSALVRQILSQGLSQDKGIDVIATAPDPFVARDKVVKLKPDVITLDIEMPRMDGIEFLQRLMPQFPVPVVVVSSLTEKGKTTTFEALKAGAVDFVTKPSSQFGGQGLNNILCELRDKIKVASQVDVSKWKSKEKQSSIPKVRSDKALSETTDKVIAIGASTGGTEALRRILVTLPAVFPGIVITQHMPPGFTKSFADSLNRDCQMEVLEASDGDRVLPGRILIAPGGLQMTVVRSGGTYLVKCKEGAKVSGHCPSVDVLMHSVAQAAGANSIGVVLTGMGRDGADGLLSMRKAGSRALAQDEKTSVVYGMPKEAFENGAAEKVLPLENIPNQLMSWLS